MWTKCSVLTSTLFEHVIQPNAKRRTVETRKVEFFNRSMPIHFVMHKNSNCSPAEQIENWWRKLDSSATEIRGFNRISLGGFFALRAQN